MYDSFWPTLPKSGITSNSPSEIFALKPYDEIPKDIQTSDETETSTEKDDIYHDKSSFIRMIRKAVNRLDDFIGFIVRELKEDFI